MQGSLKPRRSMREAPENEEQHCTVVKGTEQRTFELWAWQVRQDHGRDAGEHEGSWWSTMVDRLRGTLNMERNLRL